MEFPGARAFPLGFTCLRAVPGETPGIQRVSESSEITGRFKSQIILHDPRGFSIEPLAGSE
jgi:hypothetical protein